MKIATSRFLLRDFVAADEPALLAYRADFRFSTFYAPGEKGPEHTKYLLNLFRDWALEQPRENYQLAVVQREEPGALLGCVGLRGAGLPRDEAEFGMELAPDYWGRHAYAVEIGRAMLDFGFQELGLRLVHGSTVSANARITRLAEWFGAEVVATYAGSAWMDEENWSHLSWRITLEGWERRWRGIGAKGAEKGE